MAMVPKLPHCMLSGIRRHLEWVATRLAEFGIATEITLENSSNTAKAVFTLAPSMVNRSLALAYHGQEVVGVRTRSV